MTQKQISYFEKALETKNISVAAEELFVSRSVISRSIQELEEEFGVVLFERSKAGIEPTEAGNLLHAMILQLTGCYEALTNRFKQIGEKRQQRNLSVGVTPTNNRVICKLLYGPFKEKYPDVNISVYECYSASLLELLNSGTVDIMISPALDPEYVAIDYVDLYKVKIVVGMSKYHPLANKDRLNVNDLLEMPLGFLGNPIPTVEQTIFAAFSSQNTKPNIQARISDVDILKEMTQKGQVLCILPNDMMQSWEDVVCVPMEFFPRVSTHRVCWNKVIPLNTAGMDFVTFLTEYFEKSEEERSLIMPEDKVAESVSENKEDQKAGPPTLSENFFAELLGLPSCKSKGYCDNCGRCEH